jgi:diguanylate cyclase (GGDEF)-like protein/PAS domain S-box-containing protein
MAGSCGTAAFRREQVVVTDIATDPLWENYRDLALAHGLRACWSTPILSSRGDVLGTFALYYRRPRSPDQRTQRLIAAAAHIAGIAIERRRDEEIIRASEERYRTVVSAARDVIYTLAPDGTLTSLNPAFEEITGWECAQWVGKPFMPLIHPDDLSRALAEMKNILGGQPARFELRVLTKSGGYVVGEFTATPLLRGGRIEGILGIARDITERKKAEETIRRLAYHDALTGLPNRALFEDRLKVALAQAHRNRQMLAVMFLDLDRFKLVNDTLGHGHGDLLLKSVARDLTELVREGDTVARVGGDEFTILLADIGSAEAATAVAGRILDRLKRPRVVEGHELRVTTSIGISLYPADGTDAETLLRNADTAMYRAKDQGRDNYQCFTPAMNAGAVQRLTLERELREALERGEYVVHYQPVADLASGEVTGCEALLRWQHPRSGLLLPGEFIDVAEEIGLIVPLGEWVLRTACGQVKAWQEAGFAPVRVSVNLSARQLQDGSLVETVRQALEDTGLDPALLELEITESAVMTNVEASVAMLEELKAMGVGIAVDDFGTGYSSLSYLKQFPIGTVKIDRSFVRDITTDPNDAAIVTTIIAMAKSLKVRVIAEGVETPQQLEFLRERGCDGYQGFILSKAVPAEAFRRFLGRAGSQNGRRHARAAGVAGSKARP